jgi:hypothetical protein
MTATLLTQERAMALIKAYGADPNRWPSEWRESLSLALANDPALLACAAVEAKLDQMMTSESVELPITVESILSFTDRSVALTDTKQTKLDLRVEPSRAVLERLIDWLCFSGAQTARRGFAVAGLSLAVGIGLGLGIAVPSEDEWVASEQYVFALVEEVQADG